MGKKQKQKHQTLLKKKNTTIHSSSQQAFINCINTICLYYIIINYTYKPCQLSKLFSLRRHGIKNSNYIAGTLPGTMHTKL